MLNKIMDRYLIAKAFKILVAKTTEDFNCYLSYKIGKEDMIIYINYNNIKWQYKKDKELCVTKETFIKCYLNNDDEYFEKISKKLTNRLSRNI